MQENIIVTVITSAVTLIATITTILITHSKNTDDIKDLKADVKELKDSDKRLAVVENNINNMHEIIEDIKRRYTT